MATRRPRMPEPKEIARKRVRVYRETHRAEGDKRLDVWIPQEVEQACQTLMQQYQRGRKEMIVQLIMDAVQKLEVKEDQ